MGDAKEIVLAPITRDEANELVRRVHYSGKVTSNSQLHFGVFWNGKLEGAMQFGPSMDKHRMRGLVTGTTWNGFLELNRMAFTDVLPRNSESRAISIAMRLLRKHRPAVEWVVSFADGAQCGDGTIYRASGFLLTQIKKNGTIMRMPDGTIVARKTLDDHVGPGGKWGSEIARNMGAVTLDGFQLRYLYPLWPDVLSRLTAPVLPFSAIAEAGAGMYKGKGR